MTKTTLSPHLLPLIGLFIFATNSYLLQISTLINQDTINNIYLNVTEQLKA